MDEHEVGMRFMRQDETTAKLSDRVSAIERSGLQFQQDHNRTLAAQLATEMMKAMMGDPSIDQWNQTFDAILERLEGGGKG